jgi:putative endonuclease
MHSDRRIELGRLGESAAVRHLERAGLRTLERNYRAREGELDLIAVAGQTLVFCEIKALVARSGWSAGPVSPLEAVRPSKRLQVRRVARAWLAERRAAGTLPRFQEIRFDAIGVLLSPRGEVLRLDHVEAAF